MLVVDCKDANDKYTKEMFDYLAESVSIFPNKLNKIYYIFSKSGYKQDVLKLKNKSIHLIDYNNLFNID